MRHLLLPLLLAMGMASASEQDVYKWTDTQGVTHYSDQQPANPTARPVSLAPSRVISSQQMVETFSEEKPTTTSDHQLTTEQEAELAALEIQASDAAQAQAEDVHPEITVYTWTDQHGVKHYGNREADHENATAVDLNPSLDTTANTPD